MLIFGIPRMTQLGGLPAYRPGGSPSGVGRGQRTRSVARATRLVHDWHGQRA